MLGGTSSGWYGDSGRNASGILDEDEHKAVTDELWKESQAFRIINNMGMITKKEIETVESAEILCGPIPEDAENNCPPNETPCLFNIKEDPCEYYNLAKKEPEILNHLLQRLAAQNATAVPPKNLPIDPRANPDNFGGVWSSWE